MPETIKFSVPDLPTPDELTVIPEPEGPLFQSSEFVPPPLETAEALPEGAFMPPDLNTAEVGGETRGMWQQRVDELAIGIARADQMMNVFGAALASSAKDRYTDQEAELLREDERQKLRDDAEIQRGIEAIRQRPGPPATEDEIDVWVQKQVDRHRARDERASERRAEIEQRLRDLKVGKDEEITEAAKNLALMQQVIEEIPQSESMKKFMEAEGGGEAVKVLLTNPTGFVDLALESLPASMGGMAIGAVGGAMTGNPLLTAFGAGLGAGLPEMAGMMMQVMSEMKVDLTDPAQIEAFLADPVKRAEAYNKGLLKGGTIGGINAFFGGIAGKFLGKAIDAGAGFATKAGAAMLDTAINLGGEGVAEGASQIVTEGKLDWKDMVAEVGGAGPMAFQEITTNVIGQTRLARDEIVDPTMEILRESTQKLADAARMLEAAQAAEQENASNAVHAPDAAVAAVTEDTGNLDELDLVADAQRGIEEDTQEAIDNQEEIKAAAEAAAAEAQQATEELTTAQELLQSDEVRALEDDVRSAEQLQLYFQTAEALDTINPEAAAMMRHPKAAELFEAQRSTLPGNIFVEVQNADGSVEPGLFSGYFTPDIVSFGRYAPNENGFSHGAINPKKEGRTILTPIPSFEEWNAAQEAEAEAAQAAKAALPVVEVTPEEAAGSTATPITPTEDAVQISQATPVPRQPEAGGIQEVPETLGQTPAEAETFTLQGEQVVEQQTPDLQAAEERRVAIEDGMLDQAAEAEALAEAEAVAAYEAADEAEIQAQDLARQAELEDEAEVEATIREAAEVAADEAAAAAFTPPPLETAEDTRGNIGPEGLSVPIAPEGTAERIAATMAGIQPTTISPRMQQDLVPAEVDTGAPAAGQAFVSGLSRSPADMQMVIDERAPVGVAVSTPLSERTRQMLIDYANEGGTIFVDSGAFTSFQKGRAVNWRNVLFRYRELLSQVNPGNQGNVSIVVPDVVGNHEQSLLLAEDLQPEVQALAATGANVIVPIQKDGDRTLAEIEPEMLSAYNIAEDQLTIGIPFNARAWKEAEVLEYIRQKNAQLIAENNIQPGNEEMLNEFFAVHLLGGGQRKIQSLVNKMQDEGLFGFVTGDAFSGVGRNRAYGTATKEGQALREETQDFGEAPTTRPFEVDEVLNIADPDGTPSGTATYRGPDLNNPNKSVVWTGRSQISVNNWQLSRPTTETLTTEPEVIPEVAASREQLLELAGISEQDFADLEAVEALDARVGRDTIEDAGIPKRRLTSLRKRGLISSTQPILEMGGRIALGTARGRDMMTGETITVPAPSQAQTETLTTPTETLPAAAPVEPTPEQEANLIDLNLLDRFIETVDGDVTNLSSPGTLTRRIKRALDKNWITPEEAAEIRRIQKDMGSRDDTQDAFDELRTTLEFKREEIQGQTGIEPGQMEEGQETFGTQFPEDTMTVAAKRKLLRPAISRILPNGVVANLPIDELLSIRTVTGAARIRRLYTTAVTSQEIAAVAQMGEAGRFWYNDFRSMLEAMNVPPEQEYILAGVLATTSPNKSVRENVNWTVRVLKAWDEAGRPTENDAVIDALTPLKMWDSDFANTVAILSNPDFESAFAGLSDQSPKVKPFYEALMGNENAVVLDTHMARFFGLRQSKVAKANANRALTSRVRNIAGRLGWTPAQTQAAIWAVARYYGNAIGPNVGPNIAGRSRVPGIMAQPVTNDVLLKEDDIATLLTEDFADDFNELGFDTAAGARSLARTRTGRPTVAGGRGQTLGVSYQRSLGRRFEARFIDDRARKNGEPVASDSLFESTEQYGNEYADSLQITDPVRREESMGYVEAAIEGETEFGPEYTGTDEAAPVTDLDAELLLGQVGIVTETARQRLEAGDRISVILAEHVKGERPVFNLIGQLIKDTVDFVQTQMAMRSPYQESVKIAWLDANERVVYSEILSMGTLTQVDITTDMVEESFQRAQQMGATDRKFMIAHNHPSGVTNPSPKDKLLQQALEIYAGQNGGRMVDFVVTNGNDFYSMQAAGQVPLAEPNRAAWEGVTVADRRTLSTARQIGAMIAILRQGNPQAEFIIYQNNRLHTMAVEQMPPGLTAEEWAETAMEGAAMSGATGVNLVTSQSDPQALAIVNAITPNGLFVQDVSSNDRPSWYEGGLLRKGALVGTAERRITTGLAEDQLEFGLDPEEVRKAAAPHEVVPPPPPPPPAVSSQGSVEQAIAATGNAPDAAVSLNQKFPATEIAQYNVADLDEASTEAVDAEGLELIQNATADDLQELGVTKTQVFGKMMTILGRRGDTAAERTRAIQRAGRAFSEAGLSVEFDPANEVYRLTDPANPDELGGRALVDILKRELELGADGGRPFLSVLINSVRNKDGGMWVSPAFSQSIRNELFSLAQGEASFYGLMLGALHKHKRSLNFVASHVDVYLNRAYSKAFGGEAIGNMMDGVRREATQTATEELDKSVTPKMAGVLNRLDSMNQQGVDLDYFMGQVLDQIGKGERTAAEQTEIDQLPDLFDLPNWRNMITQRGGNQIADNILRMINPQETQDDDGFIEGNVKRMDRLLQADLNKIVKEVIPQIAKERQQPNFLQDLMTATGDIQTRQERLDLVDQRVNEELDAAEARDLEDENLDPDEVEQKYAMIREKWDEQFTQISSTLTSDAMVRRIVNQHLREVFAERNIKWGDVAKGQASVQEINESLMRRIRESFNEFNQRAPESALTENQTEQILTVLSNGFEQMARTKLENFRANQAAAAARRAEELPQRTAEGELNRLAVLHSDVQEWSVAEENAVKEAIKAQRETPASPEVFEETLIGLGVSQPTARSLSGIINRDIDARRRHEQLRREQRVASPRPERGTQEEQERKTGIKGLVDRIFAAPPRQQRDPRWQRRTALAYFQENGLNQAEAEDAWNLFKTDFVGLLKQAAKRGLETMRANLSSREKKVMNAKTGRLQLWERLERAINAGVFDQSEILKQFAAEFGWTVPTDAQVSNLKALSAREQELSGLTEDERQQIGDDPDALEAARINKAAATMNERLRLQNRMHTLYAQFSRPITWRTAEGRKNFGEAAREFISANMLFKLGFGIKQVIDVGTQWAFHMPARAIASSITRYQEAELAGDPTDFWGDVSGAIGDSVTNISTFASQAVVQWRQAMQGEGVRRNIEGMRSTISGFDRMKAEIRKNQQEVQELRNDPDYENDIEAQAVAAALSTKNAILHLMGLAEIALRFTRAMDNIQGVFVEQQEVRERLVSEILRYGEIKSPTDARRIANQILLDWRREQDLALARAKGVADENNIESSPNELRATGYEIFKSDQYSRIKAVGLDANQIQEYTETQRQTVGWNMPEETGIGGAVGVSVRALSRQIERLGIPLPLGQFSNAIAIGINRGLTWTPLGFFPSAFGGIEGATGEGANAWFKTPEDRMHRKFEAALGTSMGLAFTAMAVQGMMRVWIKPPDDPEERRIWQKEGHRAGTVEFAVGNGKFIPISLTSGPISFFRVPLTAIAAVQDAADASARRRERLEADAAAKGVPAGDIPALTMDDVAAAASLGAFSAIMGGRTAGGALRSFRAGTERDAMTVKTAITAQLSPFVVGLPGLQELQRAQEIRLDPRRASIIDLMYPTQGSDKRQYNFLSDELGPGLFQQSVQTFTGGTFGIVDPARLDADPAYKIFRAIKYRPSPIERQKGVFINGQIRVLTDEEYGKAQFERGKILKEMISTVDPDQDPAVLTAYALKYSAVSKWKALESIRAQDPELNMTNFRFGTAKTMPQQAQELFGELQALPGDQRILAYQEALAEGRIPLLNGDAHPDFLKEWRRLSQTNARARP